MLRKRRTNSTNVHLAVAVLLAFHLTQTEASPLKKDAGHDGHEEATYTSGFTKGIIEFGKGPKNPKDTGYQADSPGYPGWQHRFYAASPQLQCGPNLMNFKMFGGPSRHFPLYPNHPLFHMPSTCGYVMKKTPFGLVLEVPYEGCNLGFQDGYYILQLLWHRIPVTLKCPKPDDVTTTAAPTLPPYPPYPPYPPFPYPFPPWLYPTAAPTAPPQDPMPWPYPPPWYWPHMHKVPHGHLFHMHKPWGVPHSHGKWPFPTLYPQDPTVAPTQSVQQQQYMQFPFKDWFTSTTASPNMPWW